MEPIPKTDFKPLKSVKDYKTTKPVKREKYFDKLLTKEWIDNYFKIKL
jgi:hypothetical protein